MTKKKKLEIVKATKNDKQRKLNTTKPIITVNKICNKSFIQT